MSRPYPLNRPVIDVAICERSPLLLDMSPMAGFEDLFRTVIHALRLRCTEGGLIYDEKPTVHDNPTDPLVLVKVIILERESWCLVNKVRFYIYGMTINEVWHLCTDSPYAIIGARNIGFNSSYQGKKGLCTQVGPGVLYAIVNTQTPGVPFERAFTGLCYHFSESSRFTSFEDYVAEAMSTDVLVHKVGITSKLEYLTKNWSDLSNSWRIWATTKNFLLDANIQDKVEIYNATQLAAALAVLCE